MRRGEVWIAGDGRTDYAGKPRPVVVLQDDLFADTASVTICPATSHDPGAAPIFRLRIEPDDVNGLDSVSFLMVDKVTTVRRATLADRIGSLTPEQMLALDRSLMVFLGLAR